MTAKLSFMKGALPPYVQRRWTVFRLDIFEKRLWATPSTDLSVSRYRRAVPTPHPSLGYFCRLLSAALQRVVRGIGYIGLCP
jgi:hypothetical protein